MHIRVCVYTYIHIYTHTYTYLLFCHWVVSESFATPWTVACQAPLSTGFPRQKSWNGLPFPSPEDLPALGIKPTSPALAVDSLLLSPGKLIYIDMIDFTQIWRLRSPPRCRGWAKAPEETVAWAPGQKHSGSRPKKKLMFRIWSVRRRRYFYLHLQEIEDSEARRPLSPLEGSAFLFDESSWAPGCSWKRIWVSAPKRRWSMSRCLAASSSGGPRNRTEWGAGGRAVLWGGWKIGTRLSY